MVRRGAYSSPIDGSSLSTIMKLSKIAGTTLGHDPSSPRRRALRRNALSRGFSRQRPSWSGLSPNPLPDHS
jgi:hypothetical protein